MLTLDELLRQIASLAFSVDADRHLRTAPDGDVRIPMLLAVRNSIAETMEQQ